jgi:transcriptional regulator with XRE-family HTH domain
LRPAARPNHRLKELRRNKGWSRSVLGYEAGGVSPKTIGDIEEGRTARPQARTMFLIAEALRTSVSDLESETREKAR